MTESPDPFVQALNRYAAAVRAKNLSAFLALYADDVHVFDMWGAWELRGKDAWRELVSGWFASLGGEQVEVSFDAARAAVSAELAIGHATLTYTAISAQGEVLRSLDNRFSAALKKVDGGWLIFHEHTSAPVSHETLKATLHRIAPAPGRGGT